MKLGILYIIATPIGNLQDISKRALEVLSNVHKIAAEDTRHSKKLLQHYHIDTPLVSLHGDNEKKATRSLIDILKSGQSVGLISDAGTPLVSDPGRLLVETAHENDIQVVPIPGPCAAIAALSASGFAADRFRFVGFLSTKQGTRNDALNQLKNETQTLVFYEAPHRILKFVDELYEVFGGDREVVIARELTKQFETIKRGTLGAIKTFIESDAHQQKGEFVVMVKGADFVNEADAENIQRTLKILLNELSVKQAVKLTVELTGAKKNTVYNMALEL